MVSMHRKRAARGFTLVELLAVLGVIALLISILLPMIHRARGAAQQAACMSNMRQMALMNGMYAIDNRGSLCVMRDYLGYRIDTIDGITGPSDVSWQFGMVRRGGVQHYDFKKGFLTHYLKSQNVLACPTAVTTLDLPENPSGMVGYPKSMYGIAVIGGYVELGHSGTQVWKDAVRVTQISSPSQTAMFADALTYNGFASSLPLAFASQVFMPSHVWSQVGDQFHGRHLNGKGAVVFYDGHTELIPAAERERQQGYLSVEKTDLAHLRALHLGQLVPPDVNLRDVTWEAFDQHTRDRYDFYFWANKERKGL